MGRRGLALFAAMCVIWGIPYLFIKIAVRELEPSVLVLGRTSLAAVVLLPLAASRGALRPLLPRWLPLLAFTGVEIALPWWLLARAEQHLSSSLTALLIAAVPLIGAAVARTSGKRERFGASTLAGLAVGATGVAILVGFDTTGAGALPVAEAGVVAVCYAIGPVILDRYLHDVPAVGVVSSSLGICALAYVPVAATQLPSSLPGAEVLSSVAVLALVCSAAAFLVFLALIADVGPVRATVITYVNPAVAALAGVAFLSERFTVGMAAGFLLILTGSVLATRTAATPATVAHPSACAREDSNLRPAD